MGWFLLVSLIYIRFDAVFTTSFWRAAWGQVGGFLFVDTTALYVSFPAFTKSCLAGAGRGTTFLQVVTQKTSVSVSNICDGPTKLSFLSRRKFCLSLAKRDTCRAHRVSTGFPLFGRTSKAGNDQLCGKATSTPFVPDFRKLCGGGG